MTLLQIYAYIPTVPCSAYLLTNALLFAAVVLCSDHLMHPIHGIKLP